MNGNQWYQPGQSQSEHPRNGQRFHLAPGNPTMATAGVDSVHDAHRLLGTYPLASATPATHVSRHLSNLSLTATPPTFYVQPALYSVQYGPLAQHYSHYNEYGPEIAHLASSSVPCSDGGYWERTRNDAVRYIGEQSLYNQGFSQWDGQYPTASYQTTPFAQSIFQQTAPSVAYPTPPPPGISSSSSSLAFALGQPPPKPTPKAHRPEDSTQYFDNFLHREVSTPEGSASTSQPAQQRGTTAHVPFGQPTEASLDPLAFIPVTPYTRKRKASPTSESPAAKRMQSTTQLIQRQSTQHVTTVPLPGSQTAETPATRKKLQAFVELPPIPKIYPTPNHQKAELKWNPHTPSQKAIGKRKAVQPNELGGFGFDEDNWLDRGIKSSRGTTGDRDDRAPLSKFEALLEDIIEAEDALPPEPEPADLPIDFFSPLTVDATNPLLHPNIIRKLTSFITKVARPSRRSRQSTKDSTHCGSPKLKIALSDLDSSLLIRLLRSLERSVKVGEDMDPFGTLRHTETEPRSPSKKSIKKTSRLSEDGRAMSQTPHPEGANQDVAASLTSLPPEEPTAIELEVLAKALQTARDSVYAADCCIALLSSDRLSKQLYSEELITTCLATVKNQLTRIIFPFVEASSDLYGQTPALLRYIVQAISAECNDLRRELSETFHAITSVLPRINDLICADTMTMSEAIIIQAVYIAIGPFFVTDSSVDSRGKERKDSVVLNTFGSSAMRGLRLDALALIRSVFANHEDQRSWIIEEILSSLIKLSDTKQKAGQFRLRDGNSISTVSALLLQLVQTSTHDVRVQVRRVQKARQQAFTLREQVSHSNADDDAYLDERDMEELRLYSFGMDSAMKAAKTIVAFLTQRSGKTKATKNSNEAEYRAILDILVGDVLIVLFWPDWPAASVLLGVIMKFMVSSLDDVKSPAQNENNAAKSLALDHLGVIAARLRTNALCHGDKNKLRPLRSLEEITSILDMKALESLISVHQEISAYLYKRASEDQAYSSAHELGAVIWGQELTVAMKHAANILEDGGDGDPAHEQKVRSFSSRLKEALSIVWAESDTDVFDASSQEESVRIDLLAEELGSVQVLRSHFNLILNVILQTLDAPPVFMRTKALRALGQIIMSDPSILTAPNVRRAIEGHLLDSSAAVRDAAVELIGKYMIDWPVFASDYYQKIADRIADTGLGVRKRVIKLLKSYYTVTDDMGKKIDICIRMVLRMLDEDDTVKDAAVKTMEELWFPEVMAASQKLHDDARKSQLTTKVAIIMGVATFFKDKQSPLEDLLHKAMTGKDASGEAVLHRRYSEICETLIDGLVDASDLPGFTVVNCVRTIYLFTAAYPAILTISHASTLLPYLRNATTSEEQATTDYMLRIFRTSIPTLPKTAVKFGQELQGALQLMILKPSPTAGVAGLQETVACMCTVVQYITHDYKKLVALLRSCSTRLQQALTRPIPTKSLGSELRTLSILILIAALLCEHFDFEDLRVNNGARDDLDAVTKEPVTAHMYRTFLRLYEKYSDGHLRSRILQCLGFLFRAQPSLLTADSSSHIMDEIFDSQDEEAKSRLLKIMQEFLVCEAEKHAVLQKEKTAFKTQRLDAGLIMEELVGNTDQFADAGVSSAVVQRYLHFILKAALSRNPQMQAAAVDILSFTIKQGLAHPLQCFPIVVALETSSNPSFSSRASSLHVILHSKHTSLLNSRYLHSARASFDYQKTMTSGLVRGYKLDLEPVALLHHWYSLIREKRPTRQEFLKAMVKVFDLEIFKTSDDDINFVRYMAENFASFDYKTQEEILTVLKYLTSVLSTTGSQLIEALSPSHLLAQLHNLTPSSEQTLLAGVTSLAGGELQAQLPALRSSVVICIIMLLKAYLKTLYSISEDKCSKWVIGKKTALGDRAATRRHKDPVTWERLTYAVKPILTSEDVTMQRKEFLSIWSEDGCVAEPEDDFV